MLVGSPISFLDHCRWMHLFIIALLLVSTAMAHTLLTLNHDVGWFLVAAERLMSGGTYSSDFFEVNPPLNIAIYVPAILVHRALQTDPKISQIVFVYGLILTSTILGSRVLKDILPSRGFRNIVLTAFVVGLTILPGYNLGQREHIAVILLSPFLFGAVADHLCATRNGLLVRLPIVSMAAIGIAIKPFAVLLALCIFTLRIVRQRSFRALLDLDTLVFSLSGVTYVLAVALWFPDYVAVARYGIDLYDAYNESWTQLAADALPFSVLGAALFTLGQACLECRRIRLLNGYCAAAALAFVAVFVAQAKGWEYHMLPAATLLFMSATILLWNSLKDFAATRADGLTALSQAVTAALILLFLLGPGLTDWVSRRSTGFDARPLTSAIRDLGEGKTIFVFSSSVAPAFPLVNLTKSNWASRFSSLWLLPGIANATRNGSTPTITADMLRVLRADAIQMTLQDFIRRKPDIVLIDRRSGKRGFVGDFEFLDFFIRHREFAAIWTRFEYYSTVESFDLYVRKNLDADRSSSDVQGADQGGPK